MSIRARRYVPPMLDPPESSFDLLVEHRKRLRKALVQESREIQALEKVLSGLISERERHKFLLEEVESVLGSSPQIQLEDSSLPLRGQRIGEVAVRVLADERGLDAEVHYTEWFELFVGQGHLIAGKDPINTFLTQINRSPMVKRVGRRTGRYRLLAPA